LKQVAPGYNPKKGTVTARVTKVVIAEQPGRLFSA